MSANPVLWNLDERGVATVTLNRPEVNNAYDAGLINGVLAAMDELGSKQNLRVVVLKGNGKHFQAGADLKWINAVRPKSSEENEAVSKATFEAVQRLNTLPIPTVALEPDASILSWSLTIGRPGAARGHAPAVSVPRRCPAGGFPFAADFAFADHTSARALARIPCP